MRHGLLLPNPEVSCSDTTQVTCWRKTVLYAIRVIPPRLQHATSPTPFLGSPPEKQTVNGSVSSRNKIKTWQHCLWFMETNAGRILKKSPTSLQLWNPKGSNIQKWFCCAGEVPQRHDEDWIIGVSHPVLCISDPGQTILAPVFVSMTIWEWKCLEIDNE